MNYFTPTQFIENSANWSAAKNKKTDLQLFLLAVLSGIIIALAAAVSSTASFSIGGPSLTRVISGLFFPFGLAMVILTGAELFTGNNLMVIGVLEKQITFKNLIKNWVIVYFGNFAGSILVSIGNVFFGQLSYNNGALAVAAINTAVTKTNLPFANALVLAFFCNFLVCIGVMAASCAKDIIGKIAGAFLPVCFFVILGYEHCIANMYYIPTGIMASLNSHYSTAAASAGIDISVLGLSSFLINNLLPVTIGNIAGGICLAWLIWYCHKSS